MIFFYIKEIPGRNDQPVWIPDKHPDIRSLNRDEIQLLSWNEIQVFFHDATFTITTLNELKNCVLEVAKFDPVCQKMNKAAFDQYGVYIFKTENVQPTQENSVDISEAIDRTFLEWAHPMIGNIANSPRIRPQVLMDQFTANWSIIEHIDDITKAKIRQLAGFNADDPTSYKLEEIVRSSHDQVRICADITTLARAIVGEITTIPTRRLEKLFALDLCLSNRLYNDQVAFIHQMLNDFRGLGLDIREAIDLKKTEYLRFYFDDWLALGQAKEKQIAFYIMLIERAAPIDPEDTDKFPELIHDDIYDAMMESGEVSEWLLAWEKLPPVTRCAIIINSFRKFFRYSLSENLKWLEVPGNRYSIRWNEDRASYEYVTAAGKDFLPSFKDKLSLSWSWNRDEYHATTITYRESLLPLWGGSSGHAHGHLAFAFSCLGGGVHRDVPVDPNACKSVIAVVLSSLFPFWRLYYDKRISAIHTIAETYEASIVALNILALGMPPAPESFSSLPETELADAFDIILKCQEHDYGVISPIRLMNTLKFVYYDRMCGEGTRQYKFNQLKRILDAKRAELSNNYFIPLWSKPIIYQPRLQTDEFKEAVRRAVENSDVFRTIKIFTMRNVHVYPFTGGVGDQNLLFRFAKNKGYFTQELTDLTNSENLAALFERLTLQGSTVILNQESLGARDIPEAWAKTMLTDSLTIKNACFSGLEDNQFFIYGEISVLGMHPQSAAICFAVDPDGRLTLRIEVSGVFESLSLSELYRELPKTVNGREVLSTVALKKISNFAVENSDLLFDAQIDTKAAFWDTVKEALPLNEDVKAHCRILYYNGSAYFTANMDVDYIWNIQDNFAVGITSLILESSMEKNTFLPPRFTFLCCLGKYELEFVLNVDEDKLRAAGRWMDNQGFRLADILKLFGLASDIIILPDDLSETISGNLSLYEVDLEIYLNPAAVRSIYFGVSSEKPWELLDNKISLQPFLCVSIENPFDASQRKTNLEIKGTWKLGSGLVDAYISPTSGDIYANLRDGSKLDIPEVIDCFAQGMAIPRITLSGMRLSANWKNNSYEIILAAENLLSFTICNTQVAIRNVSFSFQYANKTLGQLLLAGELVIGGIAFIAQGGYTNEDDWEFSASGASDQRISLIEQWERFARDIPGLGGISEILPADFLSFAIRTLYISYLTKNKSFQLFVALEKIPITESFVINNVMTQVKIGEKHLESLEIKAAFQIVGLPLLLDVIKNGDGFQLSGETAKGQSLALGKLLSDFAGKVLNYSVRLPEPLQSFSIDSLHFSYDKHSGKTEFEFDCIAAFGGKDSSLAKIFSSSAHLFIHAVKLENHWSYGFSIACEMVIKQGRALSVSYCYDKTAAESENAVVLRYLAREKTDIITLGDILSGMGLRSVEDHWKFITQMGISEAMISYNFTGKSFTGELKLNSGGRLKAEFSLDESFRYRIEAVSTAVLSLADLPVAGGLTEKFLPARESFSVRDLAFYAMSEPDPTIGAPAGVRFAFTLFGEKKTWQIYEMQKKEYQLMAEKESEPKILWMKLDKTFAIFTLHRIGIGMDGSYLMLAFDASMNVAPLTFRLYGLGIGMRLSDFDLKFAITGFGIVFQNEVLTIGGELSKSGNKYQGSLIIRIQEISVFAIAEYSEDGSLFAYAVVSATIGGPPAFLITGLALGFAFNKRIALPQIDKVSDFPLVRGAMGKIAQKDMLGEISQVVSDQKGEKFIAAGVKFTTFGIAESFVMLCAAFGNGFEIDLLGLSDITMPPNCSGVTPLLHAQLALKAAVIPARRFVGIEARLTSESYLLSKDCRLTGGFAFYMWYGGEHNGDFVITLGGYHPKYQDSKPAHYPEVPRIGFHWKIDDCVNMDGEMYFALTPSAVMAGGRLSIVYEKGPLKAYFIAKADLYLSWKPFSYDASIGVTIGASLRVKLFFVSFTITVELGAELHIWGPDFSGRAKISIWIFSFEITFGANASQEQEKICWKTFCESFLPKKENQPRSPALRQAPDYVMPLKLSIQEGINGQVRLYGKEYKSVRSSGVSLSIDSVLPIHAAEINKEKLPFQPVSVVVKPMQEAGKEFHSELIVSIDSVEKPPFNVSIVTRNLPTALWGGEGELIRNVPCGIMLVSFEPQVILFPETHFISLEDLYEKGTIIIYNAFPSIDPGPAPEYDSTDSIAKFARTVNDSHVVLERINFLRELGVHESEEILLKRYAEQADSYLDEEVLIAVK